VNEPELEVRIQTLAAGGDGVARLPDGLALFVPFTAPGDRVRVRVVERKKRFARAEVSELIEPGPARVEAPCPAFGRCGGCRWQHLAYPAQLDAKREILREALSRIGGWTSPDEIPFTASPSAYGYRTRARVLLERAGAGYRQGASHALCPVERCPILVPELDAELSRLAGQAGLPVRESAPGEWELVADSAGRVRAHGLETSAATAGEAAASEFEVATDSMMISPGTFVQANRLLHGPLHRAVLAAAGRASRALELYAGAGFFSLSLARRCEALEVVESSPGAVADLRKNLARAGLSHVRVSEGQVDRVLRARAGEAVDLVLLDPPRAGLSDAATEALLGLGAPRIVYLSCDPATLSRDAARLGAGGYAVQSVQGFDLFPQTPHVEALVVLTRQHRDQG